MMTRSAAQVQWALVLVAVAAIAASEHGLAWAQPARNETSPSANGETLDALLSTTSRAFSRSKCVESIRVMKNAPAKNYYPAIAVSVPANDNLIPPGAEEWCDCLRDNEPADGIPSDFEGVFDTCRDQVLIGSDFNGMDICRGMVYLYGGSTLLWDYTTFCGRNLCPNQNGFGYYNYDFDFYYYDDAYDLSDTCGMGCVSDVSAGYCAKYRLTYGGWVIYRSWYAEMRRDIAVDGKPLRRRQYGDSYTGHRLKMDVAELMCEKLYPSDPAKCCTYARGYATLSQCCYVKNGALEFNCGTSYGGARLRYNCVRLAEKANRSEEYGLIPYSGWCYDLINYYVAHSTYQQAQLAKLPSGQVSVVFPEAFMDDFCNSKELRDIHVDGQDDFTPGTREYCCNKMHELFGQLVGNCLPNAGKLIPLGGARLPPSAVGAPPTLPSPGTPPPSCDACSFMNAKGKCKSVCQKTEECTVRNGNAFCVRCNYFRQDFEDGKNRQCCELRDGDSGTLCKPKVNNKGAKNKCFTNQGPWTNNKGLERNPQPYTIDAVQNVCTSRDNFWVNRKLCKVMDTGNGEKKCKYITKKERESILADR